jgi:hypothetical protein
MELINSDELTDYQNKSIYPYFDYNFDDEAVNLIYADHNLVLMMDFIDMSFRPPVRSLNRFIDELAPKNKSEAKLSIMIPSFEINIDADIINIKYEKNEVAIKNSESAMSSLLVTILKIKDELEYG